MPLAFDYSKWDKLELSDDEDDHPGAKFIEAESLRRIKRSQHEDKTAEREAKVQSLKEAQEADNLKKRELLAKLEAGEADKAQVEKDMQAIDKALEERKQEEEQIEKHAKFNAEEMCRDAWSVTIKGGSSSAEQEKIKAEEEANPDAAYNAFVKKHQVALDKYIERKRSYEENFEFLWENPSILHEYGMGYMLLKALDYGMEDKLKDMRRVVWQKYHIKSLLDFTEASKQAPQAMVKPFFSRLQTHPEVEKEYTESFEILFAKLVDRANEKKVEAAAELQKMKDDPESVDTEELSYEERLGPGGLDPVVVFNSLPEVLQEAYQERDVQKMKDYLETQPPEIQGDILKRMVDSGLWVTPEGVEDDD
mmetsp:Transcript_21044/g.25268  ORF Transcript_21044/g.25268 Transcript_21044/m.25268 type:complete len:365 (+) Transcript_21044:157-1251(+)|eukprot:CAMPEP_0197849020 /NCGR_PEP_ID=MMETSP1438-20131217/10597_1 /TAXON_ID=1461541 /ORGANISM="Pterosperma sp., Strain CCMP1384" /LENGTH=364 /DNA_ID=CAMNT_0043461515 /DNA_START=157 /DNA_END=1251 /DNA_ORIENTATION=-